MASTVYSPPHYTGPKLIAGYPVEQDILRMLSVVSAGFQLKRIGNNWGYGSAIEFKTLPYERKQQGPSFLTKSIKGSGVKQLRPNGMVNGPVACSDDASEYCSLLLLFDSQHDFLVPIYNALEIDFNPRTDLSSIHTKLPLYEDELTEGAIVMVMYCVGKFGGEKGGDSLIGFNLLGGILLGYNTEDPIVDGEGLSPFVLFLIIIVDIDSNNKDLEYPEVEDEEVDNDCYESDFIDDTTQGACDHCHGKGCEACCLDNSDGLHGADDKMSDVVDDAAEEGDDEDEIEN
jgi:hypothetical protein